MCLFVYEPDRNDKGKERDEKKKSICGVTTYPFILALEYRFPKIHSWRFLFRRHCLLPSSLRPSINQNTAHKITRLALAHTHTHELPLDPIHTTFPSFQTLAAAHQVPLILLLLLPPRGLL